MQRYGVSETAKLLGLPESTIRAFVDAGFVSPERGPRRSLKFSFRDLIVLRTAQSLVAAKVPQRRITRSLKILREHLPESMPLSGLSIAAVGDQVVVREGQRHWRADSGQYLLQFEGDPARGALSVVEGPETAPESRTKVVAHRSARPHVPRKAANDEAEPGNWFDHALALEDEDVQAAKKSYERAIAADPKHLAARVNLGLLLHQSGRLSDAERTYRAALLACGDDATLHFNLAVLLEDLNRRAEAVKSYEAALAAEPGMADAHYHLALLCEQIGKPRDAIRHMAQYRRLLGAR
jgi:DNA-binding transcriptional MerR regulator